MVTMQSRQYHSGESQLYNLFLSPLLLLLLLTPFGRKDVLGFRTILANPVFLIELIDIGLEAVVVIHFRNTPKTSFSRDLDG